MAQIKKNWGMIKKKLNTFITITMSTWKRVIYKFSILVCVLLSECLNYLPKVIQTIFLSLKISTCN